MPKLTKRFVDGIKPDHYKPVKLWDSELKGFGVIVLPSGRKTYCVEYRNSSRRKKRLKVGVHGVISTEEAREIAKKVLGRVAHGDDPVEQKRAEEKLQTINDLAREYIEKHGVHKRHSSLQEDRKLLNAIIIPKLGTWKIKDISRREIEDLHLSLRRTPYQANRMLALLSKMFSLAVLWGWRELNPVVGIKRFQEFKRERWLQGAELHRFLETIDRYPGSTSALFFKFLLLTGARKSEALNATWDHFDLKNGVWTKPAHLTKQNKHEHLPLSLQTLNVLRELRKINKNASTYVFPGKVEGKPLIEVRKFWNRILKEAEIENFRIHDLRHTHASHLVSSGLSLSIVGKLLGHTQASTTQRYAHLADEPLREAAQLFGNKVSNINS